MKQLPGASFPLFVLTLLAALTLWLNVMATRDDPAPAQQRPHTADAVVDNIVGSTYDENGLLRFRLSAPKLTHFDEDDSSLIESPLFTQFRAEAPPLTLKGDQAKVSAKGETVYLWGNVIVSRPGAEGRPPLIARMPDLTIQPEAGIAFTNSPVNITQGNSWINATGLQIDNNNSTLVLTSQITGEYVRQTEQP